MSMQLHPDKNPGVKGIHERFARLGVVATILRKKESRKRYDFFYKNGVPKWRGTGYYYSRFRPGLGTVLTFLTIVTSGLQLMVQRMNYKKDIGRMERFISEAKSAAWGPKLTPLEGQRKIRVNIGSSDVGSPRFLDMVVEGQDVYILDPSGDMHLLDPAAVTYPTFSNTWFYSLVKSLPSRFTAKNKSENPSEVQNSADVSEDTDDDRASITGSESGRSSISSGALRVPTAKAGGRRRKVAPRKR